MRISTVLLIHCNVNKYSEVHFYYLNIQKEINQKTVSNKIILIANKN